MQYVNGFKAYKLVVCGLLFGVVFNTTQALAVQDEERQQQRQSQSNNAELSSENGVYQVEVIDVYGEGYRSTGTKSKLTPAEAPMSYEVYESDVLESRQVDTISEALRYVPGITSENRGSATLFDQYTIRGFTSFRNYYDGLPLQYNNLWNLVPQVDAWATESIEVLKGPTSVLYGSAPPGGMVNQTAKQPLAVAHTKLRLRTGTYQLREFAADTTGALTETLNGRLIVLGRSKDGQQKTTEEERYVFAPSLTWQPTNNTILNVNIYYQDDPNMIPSTPIPSAGTRFRASYGRLDPDDYVGDEAWADYDREEILLGYKFNHKFSERFSFLQNFRYTKANALQKNTYNRGFDGANDRLLKRNAYLTDEEIEGIVVDNQLAYRLDWGSVQHSILAGFEYHTLDTNIQYQDTLGNNTPNIDLGNLNNHLINPSQLPLNTYTEDHDINQRQKGLYIQNEMKWHKLTVVAGMRWDEFDGDDDKRSTFGGAQLADEEVTINDDETSGRFAVIYSFDNGIKPYFNYSESFEPTTSIDNRTGKAFKPTTADQREVGIKFQNKDNSTRATFAAYDLRKKNVVISDNAIPPNRSQNGQVESTGFELTVYHQINDKLDATLALSHMDVEVSDDLDPALDGTTPVAVAEKQASLWANYYVNSKLRLSAGARYNGDTQIDRQNSGSVSSYTLYDLAANYDFSERYSLGLTVSNLTDEAYVSSCFSRDNCYFGAERNIELSAFARF